MTDKERAQERRALANELRAQRNYIGADYLDRSADALDSPEPDIPDGHVWYRYRGQTPQDWSPGLKFGATILNQYGQRLGGSRLEVIPARTLEPGQVAVDRSDARSAIGALHIRHSDAAAQRILTALDRAKDAE